MPSELDEITRKVMRLEIEETALKKEKDDGSKERLKNLRKELADLKAQADTMRAQWENEKKAISGVQAIREQLEQARREGERRGDSGGRRRGLAGWRLPVAAAIGVDSQIDLGAGQHQAVDLGAPGDER
jgi:ATP-dependent Clp protease ATP-binding subunit ClpA